MQDAPGFIKGKPWKTNGLKRPKYREGSPAVSRLRQERRDFSATTLDTFHEGWRGMEWWVKPGLPKKQIPQKISEMGDFTMGMTINLLVYPQKSGFTVFPVNGCSKMGDLPWDWPAKNVGNWSSKPPGARIPFWDFGCFFVLFSRENTRKIESWWQKNMAKYHDFHEPKADTKKTDS